MKGVLLKVSVDQLLFAPTFLVIFLSTMGTLNGESPKQISARVKQDFPEILVTNWKVGTKIFNLCKLCFHNSFDIFTYIGLANGSNGKFLFHTPTT